MAQRIDSALVKAGAAHSLADARTLIREGRVMVCSRDKAVWRQVGNRVVGGRFREFCSIAKHPHQNARDFAWVGDRQVFFGSKPLASSKRLKSRLLGFGKY